MTRESRTKTTLLKKAKNKTLLGISLWVLFLSAPLQLQADDWTQWGRGPDRNMASTEKGLPATFNPGTFLKGSEEVDPKSTQNIEWIAKLGSQAYGNPTIAAGRVFIGTNNMAPRQKEIIGDRGVLMSFDEKDGSFQWQLTVPKLGAGKVSDWEYLGICSSPAVDKDRIYVVTNRAEVLCLDTQGISNGNQGPFKDEEQYRSVPGQKAAPLGAQDADIIWRFDMRKELGIFPHNIASSSVLIVGDTLYVNTSNGVDWSHKNIPSPIAPSMVALDKKTGKLIGEEDTGMGTRLLHGNWSSPSYGKIKGKGMVFFGGGDGYCYGFEPEAKTNAEGFDQLMELWRFDGNPPHYRSVDGVPIRYTKRSGPSEIIATPVFYDNKVYSIIGQDPEHGPGAGALSCINPSLKGDISKTGLIWRYEGIGRSISTVAIHNDLLFAADLNGKIYCLDAQNGKLHWMHDTQGRVWSSPLVADGKLYLGNEDGVLVVFEAKKKKKLLHTAHFPGPIYSSAVSANKALYVSTQTHLYKIVSKPQSSKK